MLKSDGVNVNLSRIWLVNQLLLRCRCGLRTSDIADHHICGRGMAIVPLRFNKRMIYQQGRTLQVLSLAGIASERPSIHSSKQIPRLRIADGGLRYDERDRAVSVKATSRQGPDLRFRRDAN